ncbi:hypothetical protein BRC97_02825 [Halobacteriales archaeon QS_6_71_20]|nr:MAG: hypothetical protein BRC97_02825 [Halobacteriales archaeon QS_6_71_20]
MRSETFGSEFRRRRFYGHQYCQDGTRKLDRVVERRGLDDIDERLATRRANDASLRELTAFHDRAVLAAVTRAAEIEPVDGEAEDLRRLLRPTT